MKARTKKILCLALTGTVILSCYLAAGTFARYTTTVGGKDTTRIARFGYEVNDGNNDVEYTADGWKAVDIFDDTKTRAAGTVAEAGDMDSQMYMAPGTYGSFQIEMNALKVDVDLEMKGSEVKAVAENVSPELGLDVSEDKFLSYNISYSAGTNTASKTTPKLESVYTANRQSPEQMAADIKSCMDSIILEKGKIGIITVDWAWVDTDEYSYADTLLGLKFCGPKPDKGLEYAGDAPKLTLYIKNKATQIVADNIDAPEYTTAFTQEGRAAGEAAVDPNAGALDTYN